MKESAIAGASSKINLKLDTNFAFLDEDLMP